MNREFKFRAWHKEWSPKEREFYPGTINGMCKVKEISISNTNKTWIKLWDWSSACLLEDVELMQYTGLKDKNDKEIYEGDILEHPISKERFVVFWKNSYLGFRAKYINCEYDSHIGIQISKDKGRAIVIGNIYENLELLNDTEYSLSKD
jgi:uncharacterized phage protein (TIGR01671 family)